MWFKITGSQVELRIFAKPNAKRSAMIGVDERGVCVALHAKPQEGEANEELIAFLAGYFGVAKSKVELKRGATGRQKVIVMPLVEKLREFINENSQ